MPPVSQAPPKGSPAARVMSTSSMASEVSIGTTISMDSPQTTRPGSILENDNLLHDTYDAVLKVILLEYKNEPRFRARTPSPQPQVITRTTSPLPQSLAPPKKDSTTDARNKRMSWFGSHDEDKLPKDLLPKLKQVLGDIAMGKNKSITDPLTKRSFLRLYNDLLKPASGITKADELVVLFIGDATKEIQLMASETEMKANVYQQANTFINVVLGILRTCKHPETSIKKLQEYQKTMNSQHRASAMLHVPQQPQAPQVKPTYRLNEISSAKLIGEIFGIDDVKLQQDAIRLKDIATENVLASDLKLLKQKLEKNEAVFTPDDFDTTDAYFAWKKEEMSSLDELIQKNKPGAPTATSLTFIPMDARATFLQLLTLVLSYELDRNSDSLITNSVQVILENCAKYWRINCTSHGCLLYQAAHQSILKDPENELDPDRTEALFALLYRHIGGGAEPENWSKVDKKIWITQLSNTYIQVMSSLRSTLTGIYAAKSPKFTPILKVLFEYVEPDPFWELIPKAGLPQRWMKRLRNCVLSTTEAKYIELLGAIPRDSSLDLIHIKDTAQQIYKNVQLLQKKFPKPLLDEIFIANEAAFLFIKLFAEDVKNMLGHVEHYAVKSGKTLDFADALETYCDLRDLRDIYDQVAKAGTKSPFALEKFFFKYLDELADYTCTQFFPVVRESLQNDRFEPLDLQNGRGYSSSVLDIFKMINESFNMFKGYHWGNDIQISYIYTKLLKAMSDALGYYSARVMRMCIEDLREVKEETTNDPQELKKNPTWLFKEMKNAISVEAKLSAPPPFQFKMRTCVALNNLSQMLKMLNDLEAKIDPEKIKELVSGVNTYHKEVNNVFTIRVVRAENIKPCGTDGLTSSYVSLIDSSQRKEIGKTKVIPKTLNPLYEEEFEVETRSEHTLSISATVWDASSKVTSHDLCGRALLQLDPRKFRNDGIPEEVVRDLDIQGSLVFQVSLESEKDDAIFSIGKAHRSITRTMEKVYSLIVEKFSVFITHSFSRHTLKYICGGNGLKKPTTDECNDAIVPLFDYLNSNLQILAGTLDHDLLLNVMVQAWKVILNTMDNLLLPALASVKVLAILSNNTNWKNSLNSVMANVTNQVSIPGFGRALTHIEMDCVFIWLNALCDFFHNDGEGPSWELLKEDHYQRLMLIPRHYDQSVQELEQEVQRLTPLVLKAIKAKNFLGDDKDEVKRTDTIARSKTIMAYGTRRRRAETAQTVKRGEKETSLFQISMEDVILRVLIARDDKDFVNRRLTERERIAKSMATERLAKLAVQGRRAH